MTNERAPNSAHGGNPPQRSRNDEWGFNIRKMGLLIAVLVLATAIYYPFSPGGRQSRNISQAMQHMPIITQSIGNDRRFDRVRLNTMTAHEGCLYIGGSVRSDADLSALQQLIAATKPPVFVMWRVAVQPDTPRSSAPASTTTRTP